MKKKILLRKNSIFVMGVSIEELRRIERSHDQLIMIPRKKGVKILPPPGETLGNLALDIGEEFKTKVSSKKGAPPYIFANTAFQVLRG